MTELKPPEEIIAKLVERTMAGRLVWSRDDKSWGEARWYAREGRITWRAVFPAMNTLAWDTLSILRGRRAELVVRGIEVLMPLFRVINDLAARKEAAARESVLRMMPREYLARH